MEETAPVLETLKCATTVMSIENYVSGFRPYLNLYIAILYLFISIGLAFAILYFGQLDIWIAYAYFRWQYIVMMIAFTST